MRKISDTITRLTAYRAPHSRPGTTSHAGKLTLVEDFGTNPGALDAWSYLPETVADGMPLVVVLHGCTQNARDYDRGAGWSQLAEELGFAVLLPEQRRTNNFNLCFNWYETSDNRRDAGEPASIKQMIDFMIARYGIDPDRVFINGLSAGGAMTSVMLATYPEAFAAGAIIAGLPYGSANGVPEAFDRMRGHGGPDGPGLAALISAASPTNRRWPDISVWHGDADYTVSASNADDIIEQWRPLHGVAKASNVTDRVEGYLHRAWHDSNGRSVIHDYRITGMGHGTPLAASGADACGVSGAYMLDVAISSTRRIAFDWGLGGAAPQHGADAVSHGDVTAAPSAPRHPPRAGPPSTPSGNIQATIEDALRAAGLMT